LTLLRFVSSLLFVLIIFAAAPKYLYSADMGFRINPTDYSDIWLSDYHDIDYSPFIKGSNPTDFFEGMADNERIVIVPTPTDGGIRLNIPEKYKDRFEKWKTEFLSTEFGRRQWDAYANNKEFILTVEVSDKKGKGAGTDRYLWNDEGKLVGATISFGDQIQDGYPNPIYYPVMNSLSSGDTYYSIGGTI